MSGRCQSFRHARPYTPSKVPHKPDTPGLPAAQPTQVCRPQAAALAVLVRALASVGLATALLLASAAHAQPATSVPVSSDEVLHGNSTLANVALVFNVGAGYEPASAILETLADHQQHATFFVMGWWAERHPGELRQIAAAGHEIASHGHSIFDLTQASDAQVRADLEDADRAISSITGHSTRPLWSPSAGYRDARVRSIAADLGYRPILWTVDSGDWTTDASPESVYSHIVNGASNGAIIVLHYDSPHSAVATAEVLPAAIDALRGAGFQLMTITDLLTATT
jgi:peptidoglycan/xylan/chitin deacetylase (PgdA/CDA1 family)